MIEVREAREGDRESAARVLWKSFEVTESFEGMMKKEWIKRWHQPKEKEWAFVAVDNDRVVANLCFFIAENNKIRGQQVRFSGVWAIATEPHYRKMGLIGNIFAKAFSKMRDEGAVISIVDPFYRPFYEQFGYALAEERARHIFKKEHLRTVTLPSGLTCREARTDEDIDTILNIEKSMARFGSRLFTIRTRVENPLNQGHLTIVEKNGESVGTVQFFFTKDREHGLNMIISRTRYTNDEALIGILNIVRNYSTNVGKIIWYTDKNTPIRYFFNDIHQSESQMLGSMMMRVVDFEGYCHSIGIPKTANEEVIIELYDQQCPWNNGVYALIPNEGMLEARCGPKKPDIKLTALQLSKIVSGICPATILREYHEIECSVGIAQKLEAIFPEDIFVSYQRF